MRLLLTLLSLFSLLWATALTLFVRHMPTEPLPASVNAEAIIVLTGGNGRVERGLAMLAEGAAPVLFVSGVGEKTTTRELLAEHASPAIRKRIAETHAELVLGHYARTTVGNASEVAEFLKPRDLHRIRLVTATYHMARATHEFMQSDPSLTILPDPVLPEGFERHRWWEHANARRLVFSEFYKSLAVTLRDAIASKGSEEKNQP